MSKFKCKNERCIKLEEEEDEDIRLVLTIEEGTRHQYFVNEDGSLEFYDADGTGQETYLECNVCGQKYELDVEFDHIQLQHVLPLKKQDIEELEVRKISK